MKHSRTTIRSELQQLRSQISGDEQRVSSHAIALQVLSNMPARAGIVAGYVAHGGEIDPFPALAALRERGWQTVLPICGANASMDFSPWAPGENLTPNRYGIGEPAANPVDIGSIDTVLVPGVGFDTRGNRIGHGVGFYDRFFARCSQAGVEPHRIALAHDVQIVELPEPESWDVVMHTLLTPSQVIDTSRCA